MASMNESDLQPVRLAGGSLDGSLFSAPGPPGALIHPPLQDGQQSELYVYVLDDSGTRIAHREGLPLMRFVRTITGGVRYNVLRRGDRTRDVQTIQDYCTDEERLLIEAEAAAQGRLALDGNIDIPSPAEDDV